MAAVEVVNSPVLAGIIIAVTACIVGIILLQTPKSKRERTPVYKDIVPAEPELDFNDYLRLGNERMADYQFDEALSNFNAALKIRNDPSIHFKIGRIYASKEDLLKAITAFKYVTHVQPENIQAFFELARMYQLMQKYNDAHEAIDKILELESTNEDALKTKIKLLRSEEKYAEAIPYLEILVNSDIPLVKRREFIKLLADTLKASGEYQKVIQLYNNLVEEDKKEAHVYRLAIADLQFEIEEFAQALEQYKLVSLSISADEEMKSKMAACLCNIGVQAFDAGDHQGALDKYQEALAYDNENGVIYYNLGKVYAALRQLDKAIENFLNSLKYQPEDDATYFELGVVYEANNQNDKALQAYESSYRINPNNHAVAFAIGTLYGVYNRFDQSLQFLTHAARLKPNDVDTIYNLAVALESQKELKKAIKMYQKVLTLDKNHVEAKSNLRFLQKSLKNKGNG